MKRSSCLHALILWAVFFSEIQANSVAPTRAEMFERDRWLAGAFPAIAQPADPGGATLVVLQQNPQWWNRVQLNTAWTRRFRLGQRSYDRGLFCHAPAKIQVRLPAPGEVFEADLGIASNGTIVCSVVVGDDERYRSEVITGQQSLLPIRVDLGGAREFTICVEDAGDQISGDHSVWADARVTLHSGEVLRLGDLPIVDGQEKSEFSTTLPFDFQVAGQSFAAVADNWQKESQTEQLDDGRTRHILKWRDPQTELEVRAEITVYSDFPTVEWVVFLKNRGTEETPLIEDLHSVSIDVRRPPSLSHYGEFVLHHQTGSQSSRHDYQPFEVELGPGAAKQIATSGGRSSNASWPYFNLQWGSEGLIVVVGWSGQWDIEFRRDADAGMSIEAGQELTHLKLRPGEEIRSPTTVLQFYHGDYQRSQNLWRRWMLAHVVPRIDGKLPAPHCAAGSARVFGWMTTATEANQIEFIDRYAEENIDLDYWWMDTGWYEDIWEPNHERFPRGIRPISDHAHANGVGTILWFEPERITSEEGWVRQNHPEWVLAKEGDPQGLFNFGNPTALTWMNNRIHKVLTDNRIDFYRVDFNMDPLEHWRQNDAPDRQGMAENLWVQGLYQHWDELLRKNPKLRIDSCASGGRRNDLEMMRRAIPLWRSDYTDRSWILKTQPQTDEPSGMQCQTYGISLWLPYHGHSLDFPAPYNGRSNMYPCIASNVNMRDPDFDYDGLRRRFAEWREIADNFLGDFYPLTTYSQLEDGWMVLQFDQPDVGEGVLLAYQRPESIYPTAKIRLRALERDAMYLLKDFDASGTWETTGAELADKGLRVTAEDAPAAKIIAYRRK